MDNLNRPAERSVDPLQAPPQPVTRTKSNSVVCIDHGRARALLSPHDSDSDEGALDPGAVLSLASFQLETEARTASQGRGCTPIPSRSSTPLPVINDLTTPLLGRQERSDSVLSPMSPQISCPSSPNRRVSNSDSALKSPSGILSPLSPGRIPRPTSKLGYLLFMGIGLSPFFIINGLWSEIPIFTQEAPEGQAVGSLVGTSFQVGCFFILSKFHC